MAEVEKYIDDAVDMLLKHSERRLKNDSNKDIVECKKDLNYSINVDTHGLTARAYYKELLDTSYIYGRGTQREKEAVTCCGWVITLPKSVSDYSSVSKDDLIIIHPDEERKFFEGVTQFVSERYGTVFYNRIHYDEAGQPHIHIYFVPRTTLDHDAVQFKTSKTHKEVKTESGRYEYAVNFKTENGEKIPLKNYARMTDYFDHKISAADVLNKAELSHFHKDLAEYAKKKNLPGADSLYTGKSDGKSVSVKTLKELTKTTGLTLESLKKKPLAQDELRNLLRDTDIKPSEKRIIETINRDSLILHLQEKTHEQESKIKDLWAILSQKDKEIEGLKEDLSKAQEHIESLEKSHTPKEHEWGSSDGWGDVWTTDTKEEKIW